MSNNGTTSGFIPDGYTLSGFIKASEEWRYPALRFEYRPMVGYEKERIHEKIGKAADAEAGERTTHKALADRLVSWDLTHQGEAIELTESNVSRLEMHLGGRLLSVVMGWEADDISELENEDNDAEN